MLGSKDIDTINNSDIYDTFQDREREVASMHTVNEWSKGMSGCKKGRWHGTDSDNPG